MNLQTLRIPYIIEKLSKGGAVRYNNDIHYQNGIQFLKIFPAPGVQPYV